MVAKQSDIFDQLASSNESGDVFDQLAKQKPSRTRSLVSAPIRGAVKSLHDISALVSLNPESREGGKFHAKDRELIEKFLPTQDEAPERWLERAGGLAPTIASGPGGWAAKGLQIAAGTTGGEIAKELGFDELGQGIGELAGLAGPGLIKAASRKINSVSKAPVQRMASGLTQPRAVNAKRPGFATVTESQQAKAIQALDKEASKFTKTAIEQHAPITKRILVGHDLEKEFQKGFSDLENAAFKANPQIDVTPISDLFRKEHAKYSGLANPNPQAKKILNEIEKYGNKPATGLKNLYKTFRDNGRKKNYTYERKFLSGQQKDYTNFLDSYNRAITESIERTLPQNSAWVKDFIGLNKGYKDFKNGQNILKNLQDSMGLTSNFDTKNLERLAVDIKAQKKLGFNLGQKGADEVIQIAKDHKLAKDSIKNIPKKNWGKWDAAFPLAVFVPFVGKPVAGIKIAQLARGGYGWLLTTAARRKAASNALQAISKNDLEAYKRATASLLIDLNKRSED
jgi:hypothetical protein